jgi:hypothetical protein
MPTSSQFAFIGIFLSALLFMGAGCQSVSPTKTNISTPSHQAPSTTLDEIMLTPQDFNGFGVSDQLPRPKQQEQLFRVQLRPDLPTYFFHLVSKTSNGRIEVFRGSTSTPPLQILQLDPNRTSIEGTPLFFNVADINFDSYPDIGILAENGALWGAFEYWTYDLKTGTFVSTSAARDIREIKHNGITLDPQHKIIITDSLIGAVGGIRSIYQYENGRIHLKKEYRQENREMGNDSTIHCITQINTYLKGKKIKSIEKNIDHECESIPDTF